MSKIAVLTTCRSDFSILTPLLEKLHLYCEVEIIALGTHFSKEFGESKEVIEKDYYIKHKILYQYKISSNIESSANQISDILKKLYHLFEQSKFDSIVILGDRYESLASAQVAVMCNIPILHFHGGEITLGSKDNYYRNAITALSSYHFCATDEFKKNLLKFGENTERVFNIGALGVEKALSTSLLNKSQIEERLSIEFCQNVCLIAYHPSLTKEHSDYQLFLSQIINEKDTTFIIIDTNSDPGYADIRALNAKAALNGNVILYTNLEPQLYLSILKLSNVMVGNSSSGFIEAPALGVPFLNIGNRQKGRPRANTIFDLDKNNISEQLKSLILKEFLPELTYGDGKTSDKFIQIAENLNWSFTNKWNI